jgi:serine/threonine-protein kinase RsbT
MTRRASSSSAERVDVPEVTITVRRDADIACVQSSARSFAARCGLCVRGQWEFAIAASEAATNMLKYANDGELSLMTHPQGVMFEARDRGDGIPNIASAMRDGISEGRVAAEEISKGTRRGLGLGLGTIQRLMHDVQILPRLGGGTLLRALRRRDRAS